MESNGGISVARTKHPLLAVLLSLAYPGLGHFYLEEDGFGAYLAIFTYLGFIVSLLPLLFFVPALWSFAPWLVLVWAAILIVAAVDAYRLALRYNRFHGPSPGPTKHIDFVDSANAPITRNSLRLR